MNSFKFTLLIAFLASSAFAAPTDTPTTTTAPASVTTTAPVSVTTTAPASVTTTVPVTTPTPSPAVTLQQISEVPVVNISTFTCYGRSIGYYADPEQDCKVYHFCLLGEFNGEPVYQRISYLCLNNTIFDQQALDCVESAKISAPCKESAAHYDSSNLILRQSIVGNKMGQGESKNETTTVSA